MIYGMQAEVIMQSITREFLATLVRGDEVICEEMVFCLKRDIYETFSEIPCRRQFTLGEFMEGDAHKDELIFGLNFEEMELAYRVN